VDHGEENVPPSDIVLLPLRPEAEFVSWHAAVPGRLRTTRARVVNRRVCGDGRHGCSPSRQWR
jgi:hypothetical protein